MPDLRHLRYAVAVADHRHFGRAAAALGISQPPLSRQIAALEQELGARLFDRGAHGVELTAAGGVYVEHARRVLSDLESGSAAARLAEQGQIGAFRVAVVASALGVLLPSLIPEFHAAHPRVTMSVEEASSARGTDALLHGRVDVAVTRGPPRGPGAEQLTAVPVGAEHLIGIVAVGHPLAGQQHVGPPQLLGEPLIYPTEQDEPQLTACYRALLGVPEQLGVATARAGDLWSIMALAANGVGIGLVPSGTRSIAGDDLWCIEVRPVHRVPDLVLSYRSADPSPVLSNFLRVLARGLPSARAAIAGADARTRPVASPGR